jgi:hypothetical protein
VLNLKGHQVVCFDTLLQVLILNGLDAVVEQVLVLKQSNASRRGTTSGEALLQDARQKPQGSADSALRYRVVLAVGSAILRLK